MNVNFDISRLASDKHLEEQLVQYVADAIGGFSSIPAHRYVLRNFALTEQNLAADTVQHVTCYGYKDPVYTFDPARDYSKFMFGDATLYMFMFGMVGEWRVQVDARVPPSDGASNPVLYYVDNNSVPAYVNGMVVIPAPLSPIYETHISLVTGAGSSLNWRGNILYNGLYFAR
jgi:hypothetical protein